MLREPSSPGSLLRYTHPEPVPERLHGVLRQVDDLGYLCDGLVVIVYEVDYFTVLTGHLGDAAAQILVAFRHGLRAAEVCDLRWDQVDFNGAVLHVRRVKSGTPSTHPFHGDELRALRRLQRESPTSPFVFVSERGSPFTTAGFARMVERAAAAAGLELKAHPHMLRHACGYALANKGHDTRAIQGWLGHRSITSTAVYTALAPNRFKDFWRD
jgi:integrase